MLYCEVFRQRHLASNITPCAWTQHPQEAPDCCMRFPLSSEEATRRCVCTDIIYTPVWTYFNDFIKNNASLIPTTVVLFHWGLSLNTRRGSPTLFGGIMASQEPSPPSSLEGNKPGFPKKILANNLENKHLCKSCQRVLRRPLQAQCGHRFCSFCFHKIVRWVLLLLPAS